MLQIYTDPSGLQYLCARYYDPTTAMFISHDPMAGVYADISASWNGYSYAHGNPVMYTDPSGRCVGPLALICAKIGIDGALMLGGLLIGAYAYYANMPDEYQLYHLGERINGSVNSFFNGASNSLEDLFRPTGYPATYMPNAPLIYPGQAPFDFTIPGFQSTQLDPLIERLIPPYMPPMQESFPAGEPLSIRDLIFLSNGGPLSRFFGRGNPVTKENLRVAQTDFADYSEFMQKGLAVLRRYNQSYYDLYGSGQLELMKPDSNELDVDAGGYLVGIEVMVFPSTKYPASTASALFEEAFHAHQPSMTKFEVEFEAWQATVAWLQSSSLASESLLSPRYYSNIADYLYTGDTYDLERAIFRAYGVDSFNPGPRVPAGGLYGGG